jgi:hypothetical protein
MKIPDCKISFGIPMNVMVNDQERKVVRVLNYYSDTGFDAYFFESLDRKRNTYATSLKKQAINIRPYLVDEDGNCIELRRRTYEPNIITNRPKG